MHARRHRLQSPPLHKAHIERTIVKESAFLGFGGAMEHRTFHRILAAIIAVLIVLAGYGVYYVNDYHHAVNVGNAIQSNPTVKVTDIEDGWLFNGPGTTTAMVFYPGAKVEASAYAPLMQETAASGIDCFLMKMPANLAIFGINRADVVRSDIAGYSYDHWYIAGHSLGGTMAANYISKHTDNWDGLILLASYPTDDLSKTKLRVLSAYGSKDDILNRKKVESARQRMPKQYYERVIKGGNHAQFGSYGVQQGDGVAAISGDDQIDRTVALIRQFVTNSL